MSMTRLNPTTRPPLLLGSAEKPLFNRSVTYYYQQNQIPPPVETDEDWKKVCQSKCKEQNRPLDKSNVP